jgi:outer membrane protein assembly factor BamB
MKNNSLYFRNVNFVECNYPITTIINFQSATIVLLEKPLNENDNRNVLAFDEDGNLLWQIKNLFPNDNCHYNLMKIDENELIHLYNWCGFVVKLNPLTGEVIDTIFTK